MGTAEKEYNRWLGAVTDPEILKELKSMQDAGEAFYRNLEFGTGGLRGVIGAGTNRMNVYTVAKASQGLANYVKKTGGKKIAVSFDSRIKSDLFAKTAAGVFAANGIETVITPCLMPTPFLSFITRYYSCGAGVMVTASHNPAKYNGYKVYGSDGCQITDEAARAILTEIDSADIFDDVRIMDYEAARGKGLIKESGMDAEDAFIEAVKKQSAGTGGNLRIIYTPLNGTGLKPVLRILKETGFADVTVVSEQEMPDGNFPTCPYPNPEIREAMSLGLDYLEREKADILLATDPDCDRVGIAVREGNRCTLMTGNQVGALLTDFLVRTRQLSGNEAVVKTIVTSELGAEIARKHGAAVFTVLTGFKYIGERIGMFEERGDFDYLFGYEESYGYLAGTHARDKDAVVASMIICEAAAYWKERGLTLKQRMNQLYEEYGYYKDALDSFTFEGREGLAKIAGMMKTLRTEGPLFGGVMTDYSVPVPAEEGYGFLPASNVIKYSLADGSWIAVRPSGTEPKIKIYYSIKAADATDAERKLAEYRAVVKDKLDL